MENIDINTLMEGNTDNVTTDIVEADGGSSIFGYILTGVIGAGLGAGIMFFVDKILIKKRIEAWMEDVMSEMPVEKPKDDVSAKRAEKPKETQATDDNNETPNDNN